jgi:hypothetical protein
LDNLANFIALVFVLHFIWSYYFNCFRKGYTLDIWHYSLLFKLFAIHIMLVFSRSDLNVFALGIGLLRRTQEHVNEAYFISAIGYLGVLLGGSLWRVKLGIGLRRLFSHLIELPTRGSLFLLQSKRLLIAHGMLAVILIAGLLAYYFSVAGFGLNFGSIIIVSPTLRPFAQFATFYSMLIGSYCLARFVRYRERSMIYIFIAIGVGLIFFGSRSALAALFMLPFLVMIITMRRRLRLSLLTMGVLAALVLSVVLDAFRRPVFSISAVVAGMMLSIFYGNSFSDTRDFAVILSFWDGHYLLGKTYLAGLIAFVPRFLSQFRDTWSLGVVTATMAGFKTTEHPGLRIGSFGEAYLNFGLIAVLMLGIFVGAGIRLIDLRMKQSAAALPESGMRIYSYYIIVTVLSVAENSSIASTLYSIGFIFLASWVALKISRTLRLQLF